LKKTHFTTLPLGPYFTLLTKSNAAGCYNDTLLFEVSFFNFAGAYLQAEMCPSLLVRVRGSTDSHRRSAIYFTSSDIARAALIWQHKPTAAAAAAAVALLGDKAVVDVVVFLSVRGFS